MTPLDAVADTVLTHFTEPVGPVGQFVIVSVTLLVGGLITLVGTGYLQTYNRTRKLDPVDIRRVTDPSSEVEITGTARVHEAAIRSPFTDTECVAIDWKAERYLGGSEGSEWTTLDSGETRGEFVVEDETGSVLVDPESATVEMLTSEVVTVGPDESPPPAVDRYLSATDDVDRDHSRKRRYSERRIDVGDDIHIFGPVRESGHSVDMPGGVDVVVGVDDPDERGFTVGEDGISELVDQIKADTVQYTITNGDEAAAERNLLKSGLFMVVFGFVFGVLPLAFVLL